VSRYVAFPVCVCFVCVYPAAVGKADTAAGLLAQQSTDISSEKVSAQPTQLAASYGIGMIDLNTCRSSFVSESLVILNTVSTHNPVAIYFLIHCIACSIG